MIERIDLHDATLLGIHVEWASGRCVMQIRHQLFDCILTFKEVTSVVVPRAHPWGPSQSIYSASAPELGLFEIVMQSGDAIRIGASEVSIMNAVPART